jgi:hypothetical protein
MTPDEYREAHGMDDDTEEDAVSDDTRTDDGLAFAITRGNEHRARIATLKAELAEAREQVAIMGGEVDCATMRCMDAEAAHKLAVRELAKNFQYEAERAEPGMLLATLNDPAFVRVPRAVLEARAGWNRDAHNGLDVVFAARLLREYGGSS